MQAFYDSEPPTWEAVGNGSYLYRWEIAKSERESENEEKQEQWQCEEVTVWSPVSSNKITQAVISEMWNSDYEQKLVNEYNGAQMGIYGEDEAQAITAKYKAFLEARAKLKAQVDADCKVLNIM